MKQTWMSATAVASLIFGCVVVNQAAFAQNAKPEIVHDSEYYILERVPLDAGQRP